MKFTELNFTNTGMPVATIEYNNGDKAYLTPFRAYKFQVSRTFEGQCDLGSSQVIGLGNVINGFERSNFTGPAFCSNLDSNETIKELLKGQALIAMVKADRNHEGIDIGDFEKVILSNGKEVFVNDTLDEFIEEVYIYLAKLLAR